MKRPYLFLCVLLSACSFKSSQIGDINLKNLVGITESKDDSNITWNGLTNQELAPYVSIQVLPNDSVQSMNHVNFDQTDTAAGGDKVALDIRISGIIVIMDANKLPFSAYGCASAASCAKNISSINIEAEQIIVRGVHKLPQTWVHLDAEKIVFEDDATIDTTPLPYPSPAKTLEPDSNRPRGYDGEKGLSGGLITVNAKHLVLPSSRNPYDPVLKSNGGEGQAAGAGRNGMDGVNVPYLQVEESGGINYGLVYVEQLRMYQRKSCVGNIGDCSEARTLDGRGVDQWPGDGTNAIPPGKRGLGGDPGGVSIWAATVNGGKFSRVGMLRYIRSEGGDHGAIGPVSKGGKGGQPRYAMKWLAVGNDGPNPQYEWRVRVSQDGRDGLPMFQNLPIAPTQGELILDYYDGIQYSTDFYENKLRLIRDLYLARKFELVHRLIDSDLQVVEDWVQSEFRDRNIDLESVIGKYSAIKSRLILQQDYFGHALSEAPLYALDFNIGQFTKEVNMHLQNYYLATRIEKAIEERNMTNDLLRQAADQYDKVISKEIESSNQSADRLNDLNVKAATVKEHEATYLRMLEELNKQIEERAKNGLETKQRAEAHKKNIKILVSIAKVVPAGQPALAVAGTLAEKVIEAPEDGSVSDWIEHIKTMKDDIDALATDKSMVKSRQSMNELLAKVRPSNLDDKSFLEKVEYIEKLRAELQPSYDKIKALSEGLGKSVVSGDELQEEIARIKATDPIFTKVVVTLQEMLKQKTELVTEIGNLNMAVLQSANVIDQSIRLSMASRTTYIKSVNYQNSEAANLAKQLKKESEERLVYIYSEVLKAYAYTTLEDVQQVNNIALLKDTTENIIRQNTTPEDAMKLMNSFYMSFINRLVISLDQKFHQANPVMLLKTDSVYVDVTAEEIEKLNQEGVIEFNLERKRFGPHQRNIRLASIEIADAKFEAVSNPTGETIRSFISINHSGVGELEDMAGKSRVYTYASARNMLAWGSSFQFIGGSVRETKNQRDESYKGILGLLLSDSSNTLMYSPIFAQPAAISILNVYKRSSGSKSPNLESLQFKINYTYVESEI